MNITLPLIMCTFVLPFAPCAYAAETAPSTGTTTNAVVVNAQTTCPIMGEEIDKSLYVDHNGKRIYVCCPGCIAQIKKNPDLYIQQLEAKGITLDRTPPPAKK